MKKEPLGHYRPRFTITLHCVMCGKPFQATRPDAKFDCVKCRVAFHRASKSNKGLEDTDSDQEPR